MAHIGTGGGAEPLARLRAARGTEPMTREQVVAFLDAHRADAWEAVTCCSAPRLAVNLRLDERAVRAWYHEQIARRNAGGHVTSLKPYQPGR